MNPRYFVSALLSLALLLGARDARAQIVCTLGPSAGAYIPQYDAPPTPYAQNEFLVLLRLMCPAGCGNVTYAQNPSVPNAMTMSVQPGVSKIAYSPGFMGAIFQRFGPGASFGVIAHELGHHLDFMSPAAWYDHAWGRELRADSWAGCALARAGLDATALQTATLAIATYPSPSHPAWNLRLPAIQAGYNACGGVAPGAMYGAAPQPVMQQPSMPLPGPGLPDMTAPASAEQPTLKRWRYRYKGDAGWRKSGNFLSRDSCEEERLEKDEEFPTKECSEE